jgi:hypothetical protein
LFRSLLSLLEAGYPDAEYVNIEIHVADRRDAGTDVFMVVPVDRAKRNQYLSETEKLEERQRSHSLILSIVIDSD